MEIFADIPEYWQRIDYALMQNGPMNLYYRNEILDSDIDSLKGLGYLIEIFDCSKWENNGLMYDAFAEQLKFPDYSINWDEVKKLIKQKTKMIIINELWFLRTTISSQKSMGKLPKSSLTSFIRGHTAIY